MWKVALVVGLVGFFFRLGGVVAALAVGGYRGMSSKHPALRLARRPAFIIGGALLVLAAVHLLRGALNPDGSFC